MRYLTILCIMLWAGQGLADMGAYRFDPSHTNIIWSASHFGFSKSSGQFLDFEGVMVIDNEAPEKSEVNITIQTESIFTGLPKFDQHLKSKDFFDVENHKTASFKSTKIELVGENKAIIHGELTLLGKTKPLTLDATLNKQDINPFNQKPTIGFTVRGVIKRNEFGLDYGLPGISNEVDLWIEAEGIADVKK